MKNKLMLIVFLIFVSRMFCQQTTSTGNILRIDFTKPGINNSDTIWNWTNVNINNSKEYFMESIVAGNRLGKTQYITKLVYHENPFLPTYTNYIFNTSTQKVLKIVESPPTIDYDALTYYIPKTQIANNGTWYFYGNRSPAIFVRNDSTYNCRTVNGFNVFHLVGNAGNKTIVIARDENQKQFMYEVDLSNSPKIMLKKWVLLDGNPLMVENVYPLKDSMLVYENSNVLKLGKVSNKLYNEGIITTKDNITPANPNPQKGDIREWHPCGEYLYYLEKNRLIEQKFNYSSMSYQDRKVLIDTIPFPSNNTYPSVYSSDNHYFAFIVKDTLTVFSLLHERLVYKNSTKQVNHINEFVVDSPYVYLQQLKITTDINNEKELPDIFSLSQNYPNPFNPSTTIQYSIPVGNFPSGEGNGRGVSVTLKVYDLLGREVATLVNEEKPPGNYEVKFNVETLHGASLPTGVYFYRLQAGNYSSGSGQVYSETKKMILMK